MEDLGRQVKVNGKPLSQIAQDLKKPFEDKAFKNNDVTHNWYLPVEEFERRFDTAIGIFGYSKEVSEDRLVEVNGVPYVSVHMSITIIDDEGKPVITKEANGCSPVILIKDTGKPKNYKSDVSSAQSEAFKQLMKSFGMGVEQLKDMNAHNNKGNPSRSSEETQKMSVVLTSNFTRNDKMLKASGTVGGKNAEIIVFSRQFPEIEKKCSIDKFVSGVTQGKQFGFTGRFNEFNGKLQAIFVSDLSA